MKMRAEYPTVEHKRAAEAIGRFFSANVHVDAVILTGSCARGKATRDSCLDIIILVSPKVLSAERTMLEQRWDTFYETEPVFQKLRKIGKYSHIDLDFIDGSFTPKPRTWTSGPDEFELEIGNTLVYSMPLFERGNRFKQLKDKWLPYYDEKLRRERLTMVLSYCHNNLDHIPLYVDRGLYFQAFKRFYDAFQEFLQALFISRKTYPIAYDKWIREQIEEILGMPKLYQQLPRLFEIKNFESKEISQKAKLLKSLLKEYT